MSDWLEELDRQAGLRAKAGLTRALRPRAAGDRAVDLAGNDYLGLSRHPEVVGAAAAALAGYGLGATGSRLVRGSTEAHGALEEELAAWLGAESALVYSSGYLANVGAVRAAGAATIISDAHNHASLIDGCRLAKTAAKARVVVTPHADVGAVERALVEHPGATVVSESVFSVDGDLAALRELHAAVRRHAGLLLVDDAHALGVLGPRGAGAVAAAGLSGEPDVIVTATLSKAVGASGGIVAGPAALVRHLVDTGRTFVFDTALPPAVAAGARAGVALAAAADDRRALLRRRATEATSRLRDAGLEVSEPAAAVISITAPGPEAAVAWAADCRDRGVAVGCFRPPSTPDERARLRLTLNAGVPDDDFGRAIDVILGCRP